MKDNVDTTLDQALAQTFPASDPFYIAPLTDRIRAMSVDRNAQKAHTKKHSIRGPALRRWKTDSICSRDVK